MAKKSGNKQQAEELRKLVAAVTKTNTLLQKQFDQEKEQGKDEKGNDNRETRKKEAKSR